MDKLFSMRVFKEVVERGSFVRASDYLGIATAAATRHVASLERQLGTPLLVRTTRSLNLTERGEIYLEHLRHILNAVDDMDMTVGSAANAYIGLLRIAVPVLYGLHFLPMLLLRFQEQYPNVQFDIVLTDDPMDFATSGRDICLTYAENVIHPDTVIRRFGSTATLLCATPGYLEKSPRLSAIEDLVNHRCIALKSHRSWSDAWHLRGVDGQLHSFPVAPAIACDTSAMVYECVLKGLGIGRLPALLLKDEIESGAIVQVLAAYETPDAEIVLAYPGRTYLTSKARAFIDFISANVPGTSSGR
jgi:DNA-binding transcriptional LysR family regulator